MAHMNPKPEIVPKAQIAQNGDVIDLPASKFWRAEAILPPPGSVRLTVQG